MLTVSRLVYDGVWLGWLRVSGNRTVGVCCPSLPPMPQSRVWDGLRVLGIGMDTWVTAGPPGRPRFVQFSLLSFCIHICGTQSVGGSPPKSSVGACMLYHLSCV